MPGHVTSALRFAGSTFDLTYGTVSQRQNSLDQLCNISLSCHEKIHGVPMKTTLTEAISVYRKFLFIYHNAMEDHMIMMCNKIIVKKTYHNIVKNWHEISRILS